MVLLHRQRGHEVYGRVEPVLVLKARNGETVRLHELNLRVHKRTDPRAELWKLVVAALCQRWARGTPTETRVETRGSQWDELLRQLGVLSREGGTPSDDFKVRVAAYFGRRAYVQESNAQRLVHVQRAERDQRAEEHLRQKAEELLALKKRVAKHLDVGFTHQGKIDLFVGALSDLHTAVRVWQTMISLATSVSDRAANSERSQGVLRAGCDVAWLLLAAERFLHCIGEESAALVEPLKEYVHSTLGCVAQSHLSPKLRAVFRNLDVEERNVPTLGLELQALLATSGTKAAHLERSALRSRLNLLRPRSEQKSRLLTMDEDAAADDGSGDAPRHAPPANLLERALGEGFAESLGHDANEEADDVTDTLMLAEEVVVEHGVHDAKGTRDTAKGWVSTQSTRGPGRRPWHARAVAVTKLQVGSERDSGGGGSKSLSRDTASGATRAAQGALDSVKRMRSHGDRTGEAATTEDMAEHMASMYRQVRGVRERKRHYEGRVMRLVQRDFDYSYAEMVRQPRIQVLVDENLRLFREMFAHLATMQNPQHMEVVLMLDMSGSMIHMRKAYAEIIVVVSTVLSRLEIDFCMCKFNKAVTYMKALHAHSKQTQGADRAPHVWDESVANSALAAISPSGDTSPFVSMRQAFTDCWDTGGSHDVATTHRIALMVTDGFTTEDLGEESNQLLARYNAQCAMVHVFHKEKISEPAFDAFVTAGAKEKRLDVVSVRYDQQVARTVVDALRRRLVESLRQQRASQRASQRAGAVVHASAPAAPALGPVPELDTLIKEWWPQAPERPTHVGGGGADVRGDVRRHAWKGDQGDVPPSAPRAVWSVPHDDLVKQRKVHLAQVSAADLTRLGTHLALQLAQQVAAIERLHVVLGTALLPVNAYTQRRADVRGSTLHVGGLIRAIITDFTYTKIMSNKCAGERRDHAVCLAVDISTSMSPRVRRMHVEMVARMGTALASLEMPFVVLAFGQRVYLVKGKDDAWDASALWLLLTHTAQPEQGSCDASALATAVRLLERVDVSGARLVLLLSDGCGSQGAGGLAWASEFADARGVDVAGVGVGVHSLVDKVFHLWVKMPSAALLPAAMQCLADLMEGEHIGSRRHGGGGSHDGGGGDDDIEASMAAPEFTPAELEASEQRWETMVREAGKQANVSGDYTVDMGDAPPDFFPVHIAILFDVSGSMMATRETLGTQLRAYVKEFLRQLRGDEHNNGIKLVLRLAAVAFCGGEATLLDATPAEERVEGERCGFIPSQRAVEDDDKLGRFLDPDQTVDTLYGTLLTMIDAHVKTYMGGGDYHACEDVAGALETVLTLDWMGENAHEVLLVTDSPPRGYDARRSAALPPAMCDVVRELRKRNIRVRVGHVRPTVTEPVEASLRAEFAKHGDDGAAMVNACTMYSLPAVPPTHHILVLDNSGSMSGTYWRLLQEGVKAYIEQRENMLQRYDDRYSVILFCSSARVQCEAELAADVHVDNWRFSGGGTAFSPAMKHAATMQAEYTRRVQQRGEDPHITRVVFMTDGYGNDIHQCLEPIRRMLADHAESLLFSVGLTRDSRNTLDVLQNNAGDDAARRHFFHLREGRELKKTFLLAAAEATDVVLDQIGDVAKEAHSDILSMF